MSFLYLLDVKIPESMLERYMQQDCNREMTTYTEAQSVLRTIKKNFPISDKEDFNIL